MAQHDLTHVLAKHLDRHLVFPLLEFLQEKGLYAEEDIMRAKLALLNSTNLVDFAIDIHKMVNRTDDVPAEMQAHRTEVVAKLRKLQARASPARPLGGGRRPPPPPPARAAAAPPAALIGARAGRTAAPAARPLGGRGAAAREPARPPPAAPVVRRRASGPQPPPARRPPAAAARPARAHRARRVIAAAAAARSPDRAPAAPHSFGPLLLSTPPPNFLHTRSPTPSR